MFISHDSRDAGLAEAFGNLLTDASGGILKSFRSSDRKAIQRYPPVLFLVAVLAIRVIVGFRGNGWREISLRGRGYQFIETPQAKNPKAASDRVIQSGRTRGPPLLFADETPTLRLFYLWVLGHNFLDVPAISR